jgi:hypothetical protein
MSGRKYDVISQNGDCSRESYVRILVFRNEDNNLESPCIFRAEEYEKQEPCIKQAENRGFTFFMYVSCLASSSFLNMEVYIPPKCWLISRWLHGKD